MNKNKKPKTVKQYLIISVVLLFIYLIAINTLKLNQSTTIVNADQGKCSNCNNADTWKCHGNDCDCCGYCNFWGSGCNTNPGDGASPPQEDVCDCPTGHDGKCTGSRCYCIGNGQQCGNDCRKHTDTACNDNQQGQPTPTVPSSYSCGASAKCDVVESCSASFGKCDWSCIQSSNCFWCTPQCPSGWTDLGHDATCPSGATCQTVQCNECQNNTVCQQNPVTGTPPQNTPTPPGSTWTPPGTSTPTPTGPTQTPTPIGTHTPTPTGPTQTPTPTPTPNPLCDKVCEPNEPGSCGDELVCNADVNPPMCKNPSCSPEEQTNCICQATPTPQGPTNTPSGPTNTPTKAYATSAVSPSPTIQRTLNYPNNPTQPQSWICISHNTQGANTAQGQVHVYTSFGTLPKDRDIYIVGCIQSGNTIKCTTGNASTDTTLGIVKDPTHTFQMVNPVTNPIRLSQTNPNINAIVVSKTTQTSNHTFYAVYYADTGTSGGGASSLTYSTFEIDQDSAKCTAVRWDPYGRAFDTKSLEPIPGIEVTVLDHQKKMLNIPGLQNPLITDNSGSYRFYVEEGTYFLTIRNTLQHLFSGNNIHPHYARAYRNIYTPMEPIVEKAGSPEQRDIPMQPKKTPYYRPVGFIHSSIIPVREEHAVRFLGQTTHPLTKIQFIQNEKVLAETIADTFGFYEISLSEETVSDKYPVTHRLIKADLTKPIKEMYSTEPVNVLGIKDDSSTVKRILSYLIGEKTVTQPSENKQFVTTIPIYPQKLKIQVRNNTGTVFPRTRVQVVLESSKSIYFERMTNDNGILELNKNNIPILPYFLFVIPSDNIPFEISSREFSALSVE